MNQSRLLRAKKTWILLFFMTLITTAHQSVGEEKYAYKYVLPKNSPLIPTEPEYGGPYAYFTGEVTIKARYQFTYEVESGLIDSFVIYPDKSSLKLLPYLIERKEPEYATELHISASDADQAALELFGTDLASQVTSGKYPYISGTAEFVLIGLHVGYECDQPTFVGEYKRINKTISAPTFTKISMTGGC